MGSNHLFPYSQVSYRVIQRIADVLCESPIEETYNIVQSANDQLKALIDETQKKAEIRDIREDSAWDNINSENFNQERLQRQHTKFSQMKAIPLILNYLLGKSSMKYIEFEKSLRSEFNPVFDTQALLLRMQTKVEEIVKEFKQQKEKADFAENKPRGLEDVAEKKLEIDPQMLIKAMQEQDLSTEENSYAVAGYKTDDDFSNYDTDEIRLRARILAAFLRCLNAAIEKGLPKTRADTIAQIQDLKNLKSLTKLCSSTGWKHSTLGAKYLGVIKYIINLSPITNFRAQEDVIIFETISIALTQILHLVRTKVSNCDRIPLEKEDHFLIKEISSVGASLCSSAYTFQWSTEIDGIYKERTSLVIKSVQEQAAAYILEQLIPLKSVRDFIEILFYDMTKRERMVQGTYKVDKLDQILYMEQTRLLIGNILATYIALNENCKYRVLEFCKIGVIFNQKIFNITYLQDVMNRASMILFAIELSKHMKKN